MDTGRVTVRTSEGTLDFDLHGIVGIRVEGATPRDAGVVRRQLGPLDRPLRRPPDLTIRFTPRLRLPGLRFIEPGRSGFTDEGYVILSHHRRPVAARMPFGDGAPPRVIECQHGVHWVPLLEDWVRLLALEKGWIPLHAAAFEHRGVGVLVAGGPHGGKTSCLLAYAEPGTRFLSDDLVLLKGDGSIMLGVTDTISAADWQLDQLRAARLPGGRSDAARRATLAAARLVEWLAPRLGTGEAAALAHAVPPALRRRLKVSLSPESLFQGVQRPGASALPGRVFLAMSHASPDVAVERVDPARLAGHLAATVRLQGSRLVEHYAAYRFAFPHQECALVEDAGLRAHRLLRHALAHGETFLLRHPHPVSLAALRAAMDPVIDPVTDPGAGASAAPASAMSTDRGPIAAAAAGNAGG